MGLDLTMISKKDYDMVTADSSKWTSDLDLAYGRKTWQLAYFFEYRSESMDKNDYVYNVPESAWDEFYNLFNPYKLVLTYALDIISEIEGMNDIPEHMADSAGSKVYGFLHAIVDDLFNDDSYTLGIDWEVRAVLRWLDAYPRVKKVYASGDEVYMLKSY